MTDDQARKLDELYAWMTTMKLKGVTHFSPGTSALTQAYVDTHGDTVTAPKAYAGTIKLEIQGKLRELPFL